MAYGSAAQPQVGVDLSRCEVSDKCNAVVARALRFMCRGRQATHSNTGTCCPLLRCKQQQCCIPSTRCKPTASPAHTHDMQPVWGHLWMWACGMWCCGLSVGGVWGSVVSLQTNAMESSGVLRPTGPQAVKQDVGWNGIWILRVRLQPDCLPQAQYTKRPGLVLRVI